MSTPHEFDAEVQRRLQRFGATVDRAAADAQLARAARDASTDSTDSTTVVDFAVHRRRRDWRVVAVVAGGIGVLLAQNDGGPDDRGVAVSAGPGPVIVADSDTASTLGTEPVTTAPATTAPPTTAASTSSTSTVPAASTTAPPSPVGPPPLALAPTTTAAPSDDDGHEPVCPSYTYRVEYSLRLCDKGPAVSLIQQRLVAAGADISVDGYFGPGTEQAVRRVQQGNGLQVDGWVGPDTWGLLVPDAPGVDVDGSGRVDPDELSG